MVFGGGAMALYDPETLMVLRNALDEAWALLPENRKSTGQKSDMAQRILKKAAEGIRDPGRLRASALVAPAHTTRKKNFRMTRPTR
jgi:hypothetical protein